MDLRQDYGHKKVKLFVRATSIRGIVPHSEQLVKVKRAFDNLLGTWIEKPIEVVPKKWAG